MAKSRASALHEKLLGADLERVCFGPYVALLDFAASEPLGLSVEGSFEHSSDADWTDATKPPLVSSRLTMLTNHGVVAALVESRRRPRLTFDNDHSLVVIDDGDQYETFQIHHGDRLWSI